MSFSTPGSNTAGGLQETAGICFDAWRFWAYQLYIRGFNELNIAIRVMFSTEFEIY